MCCNIKILGCLYCNTNGLYCGWKGCRRQKLYRNTKLYGDRKARQLSGAQVGAGLSVQQALGRAGVIGCTGHAVGRRGRTRGAARRGRAGGH